MLRRTKEVGEEEETGVLRSGKRFWLSGVKRTVTNREGECSLTEGSDYDSVPPEEVEFWDIEIKENKESQYVSEEESSQARHCVRPTTPGAT